MNPPPVSPEPSNDSSTGSLSSSPFVADPGPGFDADAAAAAAAAAQADADAQARESDDAGAWQTPPVPEEKVRSVLLVGGDALHAAIGVGEYDWRATDADLRRISPPLTRIINRYDLARAAAGYSDEVALAGGVGLWAWRSLLERRAVLSGHRDIPPPPETREPPPAAPPPPPPPPPAGPEPPVVPVDVAPGYITNAERIRRARERNSHIAVTPESPSAVS